MSDETNDLVKLLETTSDDHSVGGPDQSGGGYPDQASADGSAPPADRIPARNETDVDIPDDELTRYIMANFKNDIMDKEESGWTEKRKYDRKAYYEVKDEFMGTYPWPNACNRPTSLTQIQLDTGLSLIQDLKWRNEKKVLTVNPVNDENAKDAKNLEWLLNWQCLNQLTTLEMEDLASDFYALLHGTAYEKIIREYGDKYKLDIQNIPIQNIFLPIDSKGPGIDETDRIVQLIPWSANDLRMRVGSGRYRNLDKVGKGFVPSTMSAEQLETLHREITGLGTSDKIARDTYYGAEIYFTYYPMGSIRAVELIVTFAPQTGAILRKIKNVEGMRPLADKYYYPNHGYAFHFSLPEKIRNIQEASNYTYKQKTDARDKNTSPAGFYEGNSGFDPKMSLRSPTAMHKVKNLGQIQWEPTNVAGLMEMTQELRELKLEAEAVTGFTDLQQGQYSRTSSHTLGQDQLRSSKADVRFTSVKKLVKYHWKRKMALIYKFDDMYMPRSTRVKVLGTNRYADIDKVFPHENIEGGEAVTRGLALSGEYDFGIANKTVDEQEKDNQLRSLSMDLILADPAYAQDKGIRYRAYEAKFESQGQYDFESIVPRPKEANVLTPDQIIEKLMDGEEVNPDPNSNIMDCIVEVEMFMRTGNFKEVRDKNVRFMFGRYLTLAQTMRQQQVQAFNDFQRISEMRTPAEQAGPEQFPSANGQGKSMPPPQPVPPNLP